MEVTALSFSVNTFKTTPVVISELLSREISIGNLYRKSIISNEKIFQCTQLMFSIMDSVCGIEREISRKNLRGGLSQGDSQVNLGHLSNLLKEVSHLKSFIFNHPRIRKLYFRES